MQRQGDPSPERAGGSTPGVAARPASSAWPARLLFFAVAIAVIVLDRIAKLVVQARIPLGGQIQLLPFLWLQDGQNSGAAFGIGRNATFIFAAASVVVSVGLVVYALVTRMRFWTAVALGLILGGAVGNGYDRLVHGEVTDFIALHWFPTFNLADSAVTVGVILLLLEYLLSSRRAPSS
jgi:signal peptidase II